MASAIALTVETRDCAYLRFLPKLSKFPPATIEKKNVSHSISRLWTPKRHLMDCIQGSILVTVGTDCFSPPSSPEFFLKSVSRKELSTMFIFVDLGE